MTRATDIRLNDTKAVCRLLARTINGMLKEQGREGHIDTNRGRAVVYAASVLLSALNQNDIETRISELEQKLLDCKSEEWSA